MIQASPGRVAAWTLRACLFLTLFYTAPLAPQSEADRSLLATMDAAIPPGNLPAVADADDGVARELQAGLAEFAAYVRINDRSSAERALFRFAQASVRRRDWAWPDYAMARTFLSLHVMAAPILLSQGAYEGEAHLDASWRHLREALRRDPDFFLARTLLVDLAYTGGDRELRPDMREMLAQEVSRRDPLPDALIVWARHQRTNRQYDIALTVLERAATTDVDRSILAIERARTLAALDRLADAELAYWESIDHLSHRGRDLIRADLGWILSADSLASFDAVPNEGVTEWLTRLWNERDAAAVNPAGARLREHLHRWAFAHEQFRVPAPWRREFYSRVDFAFDAVTDGCIGNATSFYQRLPIKPPYLTGDVRADEPLLDHRGLIYMRHGKPMGSTAPPDGESGASLESWVYWIEGGWRVFNFRGSGALGFHAATTLSSYLPWSAEQAWHALARLLPQYQGPAQRITAFLAGHNRAGLLPTCMPELYEAVLQHRADANVGIDTDSDSPPLVNPWPGAIRFFGLGADQDGTGRALVTFAVAADKLRGGSLGGGRVAWEIDFHIVAYRPADGRRVSIDSTRRFAGAATAPGSYLSGWFEIPLEAGTWQVAVLARQGTDTTSGAYALHRTVVVDNATTLALSDVVTGREGQPGWRAPDGGFPVNTLGSWEAGTSVELWFEVRGVAANQEYLTTMEVVPLDTRQRDRVTITTTDRSSGAVTPVRKSLGLAQLAPGRYQLVVTVAAGGETAVRRQDIQISAR